VPLFVECPLVLECRVRQAVELGTHTYFIGEIVEVHAEESILDAKGRVDPLALDPLIYCTSSQTYHRLGETVARAFVVGKTLMR
jgi:flavin reductase (DIM6/NTAB) family NADH-FMN oxidoreductase RutF